MKPADLKKTFTITAHTGSENTAENSIESVKTAFECGADVFEVDIYFDENKVPVLSHDAPVGPVPELEEVFALMAENKKILCNLDIKVTDNLKAISVLAEKYNLRDRIFYTGINEEYAVAAAKDTPDISYYLNVGLVPPEEQTYEYLNGIVSRIKQNGAVGINCQFSNVTAELVDVLHKNDLLVSVWTVNEQDDMLRIINMKPDNITTKYPVLLRSLSE